MSVEDAQTTRHAGERKSLWGYLGVHTPIRGAFHDNFQGVSGFGFRRKLASTKTQQGTDKASKHNGRTVKFMGINMEFFKLFLVFFITLSL